MRRGHRQWRPRASPAVRGRVLEVDGKPVAHALMEVWQADQDACVAVAAGGRRQHHARARAASWHGRKAPFRSILANP